MKIRSWSDLFAKCFLYKQVLGVLHKIPIYYSFLSISDDSANYSKKLIIYYALQWNFVLLANVKGYSRRRCIHLIAWMYKHLWAKNRYKVCEEMRLALPLIPAQLKEISVTCYWCPRDSLFLIRAISHFVLWNVKDYYKEHHQDMFKWGASKRST